MTAKTRAAQAPAKVGGRCPTCGKPSRQKYRPFCSRRCADVDLGRWVTGRYRIPTREAPGDGPAGAEDEGTGDGGR